MAINAEYAPPVLDSTGNPVEMLVVGCTPTVADGFANALRNQGQATHLKIAETLATLRQVLTEAPCELVILNADSLGDERSDAVEQIRAVSPHASVTLVARDPSAYRPFAIAHALQDLVNIKDAEHVALAIRREHQAQTMRQDVARLKRQLDEAEQRSNQLVQSSRDAIAYIHEGMYLGTNKAFLELFGFDSPDEIDGLPIMDMIDNQSRAGFKTALRTVEEAGRHVETFSCVGSGGRRFNATMEFSPASIEGESCTQVLIRDQSQNLELQKRIEELTSKDSQTGFLNRQAFMERLEALVDSPAGEHDDQALVQVSISNYADLRETCGYGCAEKVLGDVAAVLASTTVNAHSVARFGDHDFMILCDAHQSAMEVAERCLHNLRKQPFEQSSETPVKPVFSIGVTRTDKGTRLSAHEFVNRSCRATGLARSEGENRIILYNEQVPSDTRHMAEADAAVVRMIDHALANDGFRLKYQPIVSLQGDTRENYSVYLRLVDDSGKELVPDVFLSPASDASRLAEIDRWVVRNAIREMASHRRDGKKIVFYIILSRAGIEDDSMLLWICDCLREFRAKGSWLVFQFRESDLRNALQPARELIQGLRKINCRIAINNYTEAAQALLRHLEIDIVKLSPEYMRGLSNDASQQNRMHQVNSQLQEDGYKTIASGVEDAGSLAILWNIGVNYIQGYFLQEPSSTIVFEDDH